MLPRWHIVLGFIFSLIFWGIYPNISPVYIGLIFLSSIFIDIDHYINAAVKGKHWSLLHAFAYYKMKGKQENEEIKLGIKRKSDDFQFLHTVEFHLLVLLLGFLWIGFFFIFIGMTFHSLIDVISMSRDGCLHRREFLFSSWAARKEKRKK